MAARQIQIRRGTEDEHANFTGAIGEITMDTTNNTLRIHDGQTIGGTALAKKDEVPNISNMDYVVETQTPTAANNYTWYRKYKSGWVEQGGTKFPEYNGATVNLPVQMADNNYAVLVHILLDSGNLSGYISTATQNRTTTSFVMRGNWNTVAPSSAVWVAYGVAA